MMLKFSAREPFPSIRFNEHSYGELLAHARDVDQWLGLRVGEIEANLARGASCQAPATSIGEEQNLWVGLEPQDLLTPYLEIRGLLNRLQPRTGQTIVDLGAAYGRMAFVVAREFSGVKFVGYEYVGQRVEEARRAFERHGLQKARMEHADLTSPRLHLTPADYYFIYDYGTPKAIEKTLHDLRRMAKQRPFLLIARGRTSRYIIESRHSWLVQANPGESEARSTIYRSFSLDLNLGAQSPAA